MTYSTMGEVSLHQKCLINVFDKIYIKYRISLTETKFVMQNVIKFMPMLAYALDNALMTSGISS